MKKEWTHINAIMGSEGVELKDGHLNLSEDMLEKVNKTLEDALQAKETAEKGLLEKSNALTSLQTEFANYKNAAGDTTSSTKEKTDQKENSFYSEELEASNEARRMYNLIKGL